MPKRIHNKFNNSKRIRSSNTSTTDNECERNITDVTNISLQSNDEDFLDNNIKMTLNKRKKHLENFYDRTKTAPGTFDGEDSIFNDLIETSTVASTKRNVSINANLCQTAQSDSSVEDGFLSATRTLAPASRDPHLLSSSLADNINIKKFHLKKRIKEDIQNFLASIYSSSFSSETNIDKKKTQYVSKSTITFNTPSISNNRMDIIGSQNTNSFNINRSIIRLPNVTSQARANRPSTNIVGEMRTIDVLHSIEYREQEEKNKKLLTNKYVGLIVGIIQLKATSDIKFIIDTVQVTGYGSFSLNGTEYKNYLFIYTMMPASSHTVSISYTSIREKVVYRKDTNINSFCEFYYFPNLLEFT
ncbi:unnamed protein product [Rotaria sp. Silwood2]|nr:unnamed protein product [Rotaria sp. Silwood2]CAF4290229.1 unnamed protein product [Rotaria sp. Silwood2]